MWPHLTSSVISSTCERRSAWIPATLGVVVSLKDSAQQEHCVPLGWSTVTKNAKMNNDTAESVTASPSQTGRAVDAQKLKHAYSADPFTLLGCDAQPSITPPPPRTGATQCVSVSQWCVHDRTLSRLWGEQHELHVFQHQLRTSVLHTEEPNPLRLSGYIYFYWIKHPFIYADECINLHPPTCMLNQQHFTPSLSFRERVRRSFFFWHWRECIALVSTKRRLHLCFHQPLRQSCHSRVKLALL